MATTKTQRIGIFIIAIVMAVGTIGSFFIVIVANQNQKNDTKVQQDEYNKQLEAYQKQMAEQQKKDDALAKKLSPKYLPSFKKYASVPAPFDASKVSKLETKDLVVGTGTEVKTATDYSAYYVGWIASGKTFDSSFSADKTTLKAPLDPSGGTIEGFTNGVIGMKVGGVREITIPAKQAYGDQSPSPDVPANSPLKFIVMAIPHQTTE